MSVLDKPRLMKEFGILNRQSDIAKNKRYGIELLVLMQTCLC